MDAVLWKGLKLLTSGIEEEDVFMSKQAYTLLLDSGYNIQDMPLLWKLVVMTIVTDLSADKPIAYRQEQWDWVVEAKGSTRVNVLYDHWHAAQYSEVLNDCIVGLTFVEPPTENLMVIGTDFVQFKVYPNEAVVNLTGDIERDLKLIKETRYNGKCSICGNTVPCAHVPAVPDTLPCITATGKLRKYTP